MLLGIASYWVLESLLLAFYPALALRISRSGLILMCSRLGRGIAALLIISGITAMFFAVSAATLQSTFLLSMLATPLLLYGAISLLLRLESVANHMLLALGGLQPQKLRVAGIINFTLGMVILAILVI